MGAAVVSNARVWHAKLHKRSQEVLADKGLIFGFRKTPRSRSAAYFSPVGLREMGRRDFPLGCEAKIVTR
jgi:hypothetical protein